jgi:hypothetical protein
MMTRWRWTWAGALVLFLFAQPLAAQRPIVRVSFRIVEENFNVAYRGTLPSLQARAAGMLTAKLDSVSRFVSFVTSGSADYQLVFTLDRHNRGTVGRDEVGLWASLAGPVSGEIYWVPFRTRDEYTDARGDEARFLDRLRGTISPQHLRALSDQLLESIPVAHSRASAVAWPPLTWILPFRHADLCLATTSTFRIKNRYRNANGPVSLEVVATAEGAFDPRPFPAQHRARRNNVLAVAEGNGRQYNELRAAIRRNGVEVVAVFVEEYRMDRSICRPPVSPREAFSAAGERA